LIKVLFIFPLFSFPYPNAWFPRKNTDLSTFPFLVSLVGSSFFCRREQKESFPLWRFGRRGGRLASLLLLFLRPFSAQRRSASFSFSSLLSAAFLRSRRPELLPLSPFVKDSRVRRRAFPLGEGLVDGRTLFFPSFAAKRTAVAFFHTDIEQRPCGRSLFF